ncbi:MAG TPA: DUF86 domain-containing protein [Burkholderiales bacterium]|nr:DUF86 domain-containing protein [Burkholderiales bacterium]
MKGGLDAEVVEARLRELSRRLKRLSSKKPASLKQLVADEDLQDIVSRNLELAIQACVDVAAHVCGAHGMVPATAGDAFTMLGGAGLIQKAFGQRLRRAVGFRNLLVHEYAEVDWKIVLRVLERDTKDLAAFGKAMLALIEKEE